MINVIYAQK